MVTLPAFSLVYHSFALVGIYDSHYPAADRRRLLVTHQDNRATPARALASGGRNPTCWARQIKSVYWLVFFRLSYFDYSDLQLFAIFIFEVDFSETYLMTSAENSVSEPPNLKT